MALTLDPTNSIQILVKFIEVAQKNGVFMLQETSVLQRAIDFLLNGSEDAELTRESAKNILIQAIVKGQRGGSYTIHEASVLHTTVTYVTEHISDDIPKPISETHVEQHQNGISQATHSNKPQDKETNTESDIEYLDDLSAPIPLLNEI